MKQVLLKDQRFGVLTRPADIWMGDLNTYGTTAPPGSSPYYSIALAEPTSGFGPASGKTHFPLDKIIVRTGLNPNARGRIAPSNLAGPSNPQVTDITESDWTSGSDVPSDHRPIYVDTSPVADVPQPIASTSPSSTFVSPPDPEPPRKKRKV
jgi:hypothetical protein